MACSTPQTVFSGHSVRTSTYHQTQLIESAGGPTLNRLLIFPILGIAILEFRSKEEQVEAWKMLAYDDIREDEPRFLQFDGTGVHVVHVDEEVPIIL